MVGRDEGNFQNSSSTFASCMAMVHPTLHEHDLLRCVICFMPLIFAPGECYLIPTLAIITKSSLPTFNRNLLYFIFRTSCSLVRAGEVGGFRAIGARCTPGRPLPGRQRIRGAWHGAIQLFCLGAQVLRA